jgi:hypothetical protein
VLAVCVSNRHVSVRVMVVLYCCIISLACRNDAADAAEGVYGAVFPRLMADSQ